MNIAARGLDAGCKGKRKHRLVLLSGRVPSVSLPSVAVAWVRHEAALRDEAVAQHGTQAQQAWPPYAAEAQDAPQVWLPYELQVQQYASQVRQREQQEQLCEPQVQRRARQPRAECAQEPSRA